METIPVSSVGTTFEDRVIRGGCCQQLLEGFIIACLLLWRVLQFFVCFPCLRRHLRQIYIWPSFDYLQPFFSQTVT